jgi:hypothetical protein
MQLSQTIAKDKGISPMIQPEINAHRGTTAAARGTMAPGQTNRPTMMGA